MRKKTTELARLEALICKAANVTLEDVLSKDRTKELVDARHAIWLIAHKNLGYSFKYLGEMYHRDRTTIMHGITRMLYTDAHTTLEEGIQKACPELLIPGRKGEPKGIKDWDFETVEKAGESACG